MKKQRNIKIFYRMILIYKQPIIPFEIKKIGDKYKLQRIKTKTFVKTEYKTSQSAINAGKQFIKYRDKKKNPKGVGNRIL